MSDDPAAIARTLIDDHDYLTLATADADGTPWASPVWFAHRDHREFLWVSRPEARHSRNLATRPEVALVVFDSRVAIGAGQAVYVEATAAEVLDGEVEAGIAVFSARSMQRGARAWTAAEVRAPARHRLFRATARAHFVLDRFDQRIVADIMQG
jgi:nitroimidazol reductase NimA-like FMN-containing flavoprotein (pyridoxamine 5'-phosphate oxidase superfamily)